MRFHKTACLLASASLFALTACSGGGGGGALNTGTPTSSPLQTLVTIGIPGGFSYWGNTPTLATGTTSDFKSVPPANGTSFALDQDALSITRVSNASATPPNSITVVGTPRIAGTATFQGSIVSGGVPYPLLDLSIPSLNINASGLRGDGTLATQTDGSKVGIVVTGLSYTLLGAWDYQSANGSKNILGLAVAGYQTPNGSVPTTGTATYVGNAASGATAGGVVGTVIMKSGSDNIAAATLTGNVNLNVNFATRQANGALTNMTAKDVITGVTSPWNNVTLTGTLADKEFLNDAPGAYLNGNAQAQVAPAGATFGVTTSATGTVGGALFGPNANEVGAGWSIADNGKSAIGIFGATKQ
jgi:hypothetical protein